MGLPTKEQLLSVAKDPRYRAVGLMLFGFGLGMFCHKLPPELQTLCRYIAKILYGRE